MRGVGFRVCSECGKIWNNGRGNTKHMHDVSCKHFGTENEDNFDRSFLLYRSLNSEAIRLMIPSLSTDSDEDAQSFIAALHLGLRKKFGGHLSHLKLAIQYKPVPGMTLRTQHVYLYDAVPGGTGYLKELTRNAAALLDVLEIALKELTSCSCKHDPERDGCPFDQLYHSTPEVLINRGLYKKAAISCVREPLRSVSFSLIAKAVGAVPVQTRFAELAHSPGKAVRKAFCPRRPRYVPSRLAGPCSRYSW